MSNAFFTHTAPFQSGTTVRADGVNAKFDGVEAAFDATEIRLDKSLTIHPDAVVGNMQIPNITVANSFLMFNMSKDLVLFDKTGFDTDVVNTDSNASSASNSAQVALDSKDVAVAAAFSASTSKDESLASKTLSQQYANHPEDSVIPNTTEYSAFHWKRKAEAIAGGVAPDSLKLGGQLPAYYVAASSVSNVDNTSDADKPISTAQQAVLDAQQVQIDEAILLSLGVR